MCRTHDTCSAMYVHANVAFRGQRRFARVQPHAHAHGHTFRPGMSSEGALRLNDCQHRVSSTSKGDEEAITLGIDLVAIPLLEGGTQHLPALRQHTAIAVTQLLEQVSRFFDVSEEQGDRSCWEAAQRGFTLPIPGWVLRRRSKACSSGRFRMECLLQGRGKVLYRGKAQLGVLGKGLEYDLLKCR